MSINADGKISIFHENKENIVRNKGKSLLSLPTHYTIIDIETTGLNPNFDEIIEFAALKVENNEVVNTLIR